MRHGIAHQGDFLPDTLRAQNATTVVVCLHSSECSACRKYVAALAGLASEFQVWDARLVIVVPDGTRDAFRSAVSKTVVAPADSPCSPDSAAVLVADRYGHIFHAAYSGAEHALPGPREIDEWLKYLGTLCPE